MVGGDVVAHLQEDLPLDGGGQLASDRDRFDIRATQNLNLLGMGRGWDDQVIVEDELFRMTDRHRLADTPRVNNLAGQGGGRADLRAGQIDLIVGRAASPLEVSIEASQ